MPEGEMRSWWFKNNAGWRIYADCKDDVIYDCSLPKFHNRPVKVLADWMRKDGGFSFEEISPPTIEKKGK